MRQNITAEYIKEARAKYDSYGSEWEKAYFDEKTGGYNVQHVNHNFSKVGGGGDVEVVVGKILANQGKQVEFLPEGWKRQPDIKFDHQTWDIKKITDANIETMRTYIKDARKAENVIFYWKDKDGKFDELISAIGRIEGYFRKKNELHTMPNIYYIGENKLKLLWSK